MIDKKSAIFIKSAELRDVLQDDATTVLVTENVLEILKDFEENVDYIFTDKWLGGSIG